MCQTEVNADGFARWLNTDVTLGIDGELGIISVRAAQEAYPLDGPQRMPQQITCPPQRERPCFQAIGQREVPPHLIKLPARGLVLDGPTVFLEARIPLLAGLLLAAPLVEAHDGGPGTLRSS